MALKLKAELGGDGTGFERMMSKAGVTANSFANNSIAPLKNLIAGAFSVGAISALSKSTIAYAGHLRDVSDELGLNVEYLQELQYTAVQAGAKIEDLEKFLSHVNRSREAALSNPQGKEMAGFNKFGISAAEVQSSSMQGIIQKLDAAFKTGVQSDLEPAFHAIGGKGADKLIAAFVGGIDSQREKSRAQGAVMADDIVSQLDEIGDKFAVAGIRLKVEFGSIIITMIDWVRRLANAASQAGSFIGAGTSNWSWKDVLSFAKRPWNAFKGGSGAGAYPPFDMDAGGQAVMNTEQDFKQQLAIEAARRAAEKAARDERNNRKRDVQPLVPSAEKFTFAKNSDSLSGVGNFLGGNGVGASLVSIGEKTNQILNQMHGTLGIIASNTGRSSFGDGGVPQS